MNQIAIRNLDDAKNFISAMRGAFEARADDKTKMNFAREAGFAMQALENNDFLLSTAKGNPNSLKNAITNISAIGLSLNPAEKVAHLVPMDKRVNLMVSYMGLIKLATQSGSIVFAKSEIVRKNDDFELQGMEKPPLHKFNPFGDRGEIIGCYCTAKLNSGEYMTTVMTMDEVNQVKKCSKTAGKSFSPWSSFPEQMILKTVLKRASKYWPSPSKQLLEAIEVSNVSEGYDFSENDDRPSDKEIAQAKEARKEKLRLESIERDDLTEAIKHELGELTADLDLTGKAKFLVEKLEVKSFTEIERASLEQLREFLKKLEAQND